MTIDQPKVPFRVIALQRDEATNLYQAVISFRKIEKGKGRIIVNASTLDDKKQLRASLKDAGALFSRVESENDDAFKRLNRDWERAKRWLRAACTGWSVGRTGFVLPYCALGDHPKYDRVLPPAIEEFKNIGRTKNIALWRQTVAKPAQFSSRIALSLCAVFAAPLLRLLDLQGFGVFLSGPSKTGKTTGLLAAASGIGFKSEEDVPNFNSSKGGLPELFEAFNDLAIPIDERASQDGSTAYQHSEMERLAFLSAGGRSRRRSRHSQQRSEQKSFRAIVLANGEESLGRLAALTGTPRLTGAAVRFVDLPACRAGNTDIYDLAPKGMKGAARETWRRKINGDLRSAYSASYGDALFRFTKRLLKAPTKAEADARKLSSDFVLRAVEAGDGDDLAHLAMLFGALYAGGILAVRLGVLPWSERFVLKVVLRCYKDARDAMQTVATVKREGLTIVGKHTSKLRKRRTKFKPSDRHFFDKEKNELVVRADAFCAWLRNKQQAALVLEELHSRMALGIERATKPIPNTVEWAETQRRWPDGSRPRSIALRVDRLRG
jgi:hypothetical protein